MVGDGDGLGQVREEELYRAYERLGVPPENVIILDDPYVTLHSSRWMKLIVDGYKME
jgi:LmbE family N-acetylglucosaminyl deacetylase